MRKISREQTIHPVLILWLLVGWIGFFFLPWYGIEDGFFSFEWLLDGYPFEPDYAPAILCVQRSSSIV